MSIFPISIMEPLVNITPFSREAFGNVDNIGLNGQLGALTSTAWPTQNKALFFPFFTTKPISILNFFCINGATASGNIDIGVYDTIGTKIISTGSTPQSGTSVVQAVSVSSTEIGPGQFYLAMAMDNTTGTIQIVTATSASGIQALGAAQQTTAFALPATATFATMTANYLPAFGLSTRSVV